MILNFIKFLLKSMRRFLRRPGRGDGLTNRSRSGRQSHRGCGCLWAILGGKLRRCSRTHSRDSPSDRRGIRLSGNSRRTPCCGNEREVGYLGLYLSPDLGEDGSIFGIISTEAMHLAAPVVVVFWFGLDEGVELIHYLAAPHHYYAHGADG